MSTIATRAEEASPPRRWLAVPWLSGRLILLTLAFSVLAQILVYLPSVSLFVQAWTGDRVMGAQMVALAISAAPGDRSRELDARLLEGVKGAEAIGIRGTGTRWLLTHHGVPPQADREVDLRQPTWYGPLRAALRALVARGPSVVRILAPGFVNVPGVEAVELLLNDTPFRDAVREFTWKFFGVSLVIVLITGALLYLALHLMVVRPVRRLSLNIEGFAAHPEEAGRIIVPSGRHDEIGRAEDALAGMQRVLAGELRRKRHLADLGLAVSKINHDLRNMLTTAQLLGDRLGQVDDPTVRRIAPRLVRTLDRAIAFCGATLAYGRANEPAPARRRVPLAPLVAEQVDLAGAPDGVAVAIEVDIPVGLEVDADPDQLTRVLQNLIRNAVEALARSETALPRVVVEARRQGGLVEIRVSDNGPGVPERIRARLFSAFQASERSGGTGLGLPVADELVRLHGGTIVLETDRAGGGATFLVTVPDRVPPPR